MEPKKYEHQRIERKIPLFYLIGLNIALLLTIAAFQWKTSSSGFVDFDNMVKNEEWEQQLVIPQPPPPVPPSPPQPIVIVETTVEPVDVPKAIIDVETTDVVEPIDFTPVIPVDVGDEAPFVVVEEMPSYPGGWEAFYKFVGKNMKYPKAAQRMGIEGRVFMEFIIEKDGSISGLKVVKGMRGGLDEEAMRVMNMLPKFNPGKQRDKPVRVHQSISINFQLQK